MPQIGSPTGGPTRVAHFSFITHVERQLCTVNQGYAMVTKHKATVNEEIKRISFVQRYKRKAVESKATIQPFATDKEAGSQRARQSTRNEGSNGSYKRGAYRGNRNNKNSLQGNIAELGNNVSQYGTQDRGEKVHQNDRGKEDMI
jgi:hypothetical protein